MDLSGPPQFTVEEIQPTTKAGASVIGRLSHLRGVRNTRGFLYRSPGPSIVGDLAMVPLRIEERVELNVATSDLTLAPELQIGVEFPWLDGYWQPRHLSMILAPSGRWERRRFVSTPARYVRVDGVRGWQRDGERCLLVPRPSAYDRMAGITSIANFARRALALTEIPRDMSIRMTTGSAPTVSRDTRDTTISHSRLRPNTPLQLPNAPCIIIAS
jgi:hypothetical protein